MTTRRGRARLYTLSRPGRFPTTARRSSGPSSSDTPPRSRSSLNEMLAFLGMDAAALDELERDSRYLIGRLTQALAELRAAETPPLDATSQLLVSAITDAMACRRRGCGKCPPEGDCPVCWPDWQQAMRYEALFGLLGIVDEKPRARPDLKATGR